MKKYIVLIGTYDEITTEEVVTKEVSMEGLSPQEVHKEAFLNVCNTNLGQDVIRIKLAGTKKVVFDHLIGFAS